MHIYGVHIRLSVQCATQIKLQSYAALATQLGFSQFCLVIVLESQQNKRPTKCEIFCSDSLWNKRWTVSEGSPCNFARRPEISHFLLCLALHCSTWSATVLFDQLPAGNKYKYKYKYKSPGIHHDHPPPKGWNQEQKVDCKNINKQKYKCMFRYLQKHIRCMLKI